MKAVIFDMDGVLVNSEEQWKLLEGPFMRVVVPGWKEEDHHRIVGLGVPDLFKFLVREYQAKISWEDFLKECEKLGKIVYGEKVELYPGFLELFDELLARRLPVGLATSSPRRWVELVLKRFELGDRFSAVITIDDVGGEGKPSPAIYLETARRLGVEPRDCVAIEDSIYGVESAKRAGMRAIAFRNGANGPQDLSAAEEEVVGHAQLRRLLLAPAK